jgi:hypothetical protein
MIPTKTELEQVVREEIVRGGFPGTCVLTEHSGHPNFQAGIDTNSLSQINIGVNSAYETVHPGKIIPIVKDITRHEINHRKYEKHQGCPRELELHVEKIIEPMAEVLVPKDYSPDDIHYVANCLEDTILHDDLNSEFSLNGITNFFEDVGEHASKQRYTPFYEAHVKLNLALWGLKPQKRKLRKFFTQNKKDSEVTKVLQAFLEKSGLSELTQKYEAQQIRDRTEMRNYLNDEQNWPKIAQAYAEEFSKLMQPGYALPIFNHSGKGTQKEENRSIKVPFSGEGNPFDREMHRSGYKKERVVRAYRSGKCIPPLITSFEALDYIYEHLAQRLNLNVESYTQQTSLPVVFYGKTDFDPDRDKPKHLTFGFDEQGKPTLMRKRYHEDIPLEFKVNPNGIPEARFVLLDASESTKHSPTCSGCSGYSCAGSKSIIPWGDNSKFHYEVLGWYGLLEYFKQNHLLTQTGISLGVFSSETHLGQSLVEAKKQALSPQFGNTYLDMEKLQSIFRGERMLVMSTSDGEIANWNSWLVEPKVNAENEIIKPGITVGNEFIRLAKRHYYFHLQVGGDNQFTSDLRANGLAAFNVKGDYDLANTVIDLTDKLYRGN